MSSQAVESTSKLTVNFGGAKEISASTLSVSLKTMTDIMSTITAVGIPDSYCKINVTETREGSWEMDLSSLVVTAAGLIGSGPEGQYLAQRCTEWFFSIFELKLFLKGNPPKEVKDGEDKSDNLVIKNCDNETTEVSRDSWELFRNASINYSTINLFNVLDSDTARDSFNLRSDGRALSIPKSSFPMMAVAFNEKDEERKITNDINASVRIVKPAYSGDSKWRIWYQKQVDAKILDADWLASFQSAEISAPPGSWLRVDMKQTVYMDEKMNPISDPEYEIVKVIKVIGPEAQNSLFDFPG